MGGGSDAVRVSVRSTALSEGGPGALVRSHPRRGGDVPAQKGRRGGRGGGKEGEEGGKEVLVLEEGVRDVLEGLFKKDPQERWTLGMLKGHAWLERAQKEDEDEDRRRDEEEEKARREKEEKEEEGVKEGGRGE